MENYWEANGHPPHPVKYENDATVANFAYCNEPGLNFSTSGTAYSEDDADFTPGRRGKTSRQDPLSHRIIEKRRRDRMNSCLADLSRLIPPQYMRKGRGRVEKTEIIEMAIKHLKNLQNQECIKRETTCADHYRIGYHDCLSEAAKFLMAENCNDLCYRMVTRLKEVVRNEILKGECSKIRSGNENTNGISASPGVPQYEPPMSQLRDILTSNSDVEHSSNDHLDVKDLSFRTANSSQPVSTSNTANPLEANSTDYENSRASSNHTDHLETDLRTLRMRKFSETSTTADHEHNNNSYKFKNYIKQRFSQDNHLDDKVGSSSGSSGSTEKHEVPSSSKKRRSELSVNDELDERNGLPEPKVEFMSHSTSSTTSSISNGRHPIQSFCVPIFACHTQGYYIPLNVEYAALIPYLGEIDLLNKNCNQMPPLHPVSININYSPTMIKTTAANFVKPKLENGW